MLTPPKHEVALRALLATIREDYGSVKVWMIHAPVMEGAPDAEALDELAELLTRLEAAPC